MRLQASRGSMSLGESQGGLPPDSVVDSEEAILQRQPAPDRALPRSQTRRDGADRAGALFALQRDRRVDAPERRAGARSMACTCTPTWQKPRTKKPSACRNSATARWPTCNRWIGSARMSGLPTRCMSTRRKSRYMPAPAAAWRTAHLRICAWLPASPRVREYMRAGRQGGLGRGWLGQQRRLAHAGGSAPGDAAGPAAGRH